MNRLATLLRLRLYFVSKEAAEDVKLCFPARVRTKCSADIMYTAKRSAAPATAGCLSVFSRVIGKAVDHMPPFKAKNFLYRHRGDLQDWFNGNPNAGFSERERKQI